MGDKLKGISPIVASVLLIAFSTAIAAIVGTWAMNYTQAKLSGIEMCKNLEVYYYNFSYNPETKEGSVTLQNIGAPVDGYRIYALIDVNQKALVKEIKTRIPKSEKKEISFGIELENIKGIMVEVINCPNTRLFIPVT